MVGGGDIETAFMNDDRAREYIEELEAQMKTRNYEPKIEIKRVHDQ